MVNFTRRVYRNGHEFVGVVISTYPETQKFQQLVLVIAGPRELLAPLIRQSA